MNQEIIKLAEAGGWIDKEAIAGFARTPQRESQILLDKEFWIALGVSLNWSEEFDTNTGEYHDGHWDRFIEREWRWKAHQYLDARFEGREQEFFKELIEK